MKELIDQILVSPRERRTNDKNRIIKNFWGLASKVEFIVRLLRSIVALINELRSLFP
jgi:hypothetical protein